jgi:hypothetical protein
LVLSGYCKNILLPDCIPCESDYTSAMAEQTTAPAVSVTPAHLEAEVLARAVARATAERTVLSELLAGASLREVWERWRVL